MPRYRNVNSSGGLHSKHAQAASPPCGRATLAGRTVGEIRYPQLIGTIGFELPVHVVQRAWCRRIGHRGTHRLAAPCALNTKSSHQPLNRATCHGLFFAVKLTPDFISAVNPHGLLPNPVNLGYQNFISLGTGTQQFWVPLLCGIATVA